MNYFLKGPTLKTWYMLLNRFIIGAPAAKTFKMVAVDQVIFYYKTKCSVLMHVT